MYQSHEHQSLSISDAHCYFHLLYADDMPKLVRGDSARVVQIFANLISNSIKFTTSRFDNCISNFPRFDHAYQRNVN